MAILDDALSRFESLPDEVKQRIIERGMEAPPFSEDADEIKVELTKRLELFQQEHTFHVGQFVQWKPGLDNKKRPRKKEPAIVVRTLDEPIFDPDETNAGSPLFRDPLDIILGMLSTDGELLLYHFNSRRFEPLPSVPKDPAASRADGGA